MSDFRFSEAGWRCAQENTLLRGFTTSPPTRQSMFSLSPFREQTGADVAAQCPIEDVKEVAFALVAFDLDRLVHHRNGLGKLHYGRIEGLEVECRARAAAYQVSVTGENRVDHFVVP